MTKFVRSSRNLQNLVELSRRRCQNRRSGDTSFRSLLTPHSARTTVRAVPFLGLLPFGSSLLTRYGVKAVFSGLSGTVGRGRVGEWGSGEGDSGGGESGRIFLLPNAFRSRMPSSFFLLPSSFFLRNPSEACSENL